MSIQTAICVILAIVPGQAQANINDLDWIIGDWTARVQARDAIAGVAPAGAPITQESSFRWILNRTRIQWDFQAKHDGTVFYTARAILGPNEDGKLTHWWFDSAGDVDTARWNADDGGWKVHGTRNSWRVYRDAGEDTFIVTQVRVGGRVLPVERVIVHKRQPSATKVDTSNDEQ